MVLEGFRVLRKWKKKPGERLEWKQLKFDKNFKKETCGSHFLSLTQHFLSLTNLYLLSYKPTSFTPFLTPSNTHTNTHITPTKSSAFCCLFYSSVPNLTSSFTQSINQQNKSFTNHNR